MTRTAASPPVDEPWRKYDDIEARLTAPVSERMIDLAELRPGMRVLDLASGRGEPALRAARRVAPHGSVLGVDVLDSVLAIARERARAEGIANVELRASSAESLDELAAGSFDAATARWGLMYMQAPLRALAGTHRALRPGAVLVAAFWAEPDRVPWATVPRRVLGRYCQMPAIVADAPGAFRYADVAHIERDFAEAGFVMEAVEEMDIPVIEADSGESIVAWVRDLGFARHAGGLSEDRQAAWQSELAGELEAYRVGGAVRLGGVTRLVVGRVP